MIETKTSGRVKPGDVVILTADNGEQLTARFESRWQDGTCWFRDTTTGREFGFTLRSLLSLANDKLIFS